MHASAGDEIVVDGPHLGDPRRSGEVLEVLDEGGAVHYRIRWDDGHESIFFPRLRRPRDPRPARASIDHTYCGLSTLVVGWRHSTAQG
ncbi:MAG: DUF1918 domain-containing protein [Acidimicrobiia bacterium]|nr:DUF1918 domain-containing protein [Acidimicrobiia bacterium]